MGSSLRIACYRKPNADGFLDNESHIEYAAHPAIFFHAERYRGSREGVRTEIMSVSRVEEALDIVKHTPLSDIELSRWGRVRQSVASCSAWWARECDENFASVFRPEIFDNLDMASVLGGIGRDDLRTVRLIIAGSRDLSQRGESFALIDWYINTVLFALPSGSSLLREVLSGNQRGGDSIGEEWAMARYMPVIHFPANWSEQGNAAGPIRNRLMGKRGTHLLAFHLHHSRGTANMLAVMNELKKPHYAFNENDLIRMHTRLKAHDTIQPVPVSESTEPRR